MSMPIMNFVVWILMGGVLGWIASAIVDTDRQQDLLFNIVVGIAGAFLAGLVLSPLLCKEHINDGDFGLGLGPLIVALVGAVTPLMGMNLLRRRTVRRAQQAALIARRTAEPN